MADLMTIKKRVLAYRRILQRNHWADFSCGGFSMRLSGTESVCYLPSSFENKYDAKDSDVQEKSLNGDFEDDLCSGLWKDGFKIYGVVAIAHIVSVKAILISRLHGAEFVFKLNNKHLFKVMGEHMNGQEYRLPIVEDKNPIPNLCEGVRCCVEAKPIQRVETFGKSADPFECLQPKESGSVQHVSAVPPKFGWKCANPNCERGGIIPSAVLVKNRGLYVFGPTIELTMKRCEAIHMMFELALEEACSPGIAGQASKTEPMED